MTNLNRWQKAQNYEKNWWKDRHQTINLNYLKRFADDLINDLMGKYQITENTNILEIGAGPAGILTHLPGKLRVAIDPLNDFYSSIEHYNQYRDKNIEYINAKGESLPYSDSLFDLVIIDNVLDHCEVPEKVVSEIHRVLKPDGIIYFKQNVYHSLGKVIRNILEQFEFDKGHPHNYTQDDIFNLFNNYNFKIISKKNRGHFNQFLVELKMKNIKAFIRIFTFMTRDKITVIFRK